MLLLTETIRDRYIKLMEASGSDDKESGSYDQKQVLQEIAGVLAETSNPGLIRRFLESLLTASELDEVSSRWELVRRINRGVSQRTIAKDLGLSLCKITRGSKVLKEPESAFRIMIQKAENPENPENPENHHQTTE